MITFLVLRRSFITHLSHWVNSKTLETLAPICLAYFSPLFGSIAADNYFGRFKVILWVSVISVGFLNEMLKVSLVYVAGHVLLSVGAIPYIDYTLRSIFDFSGLIVIALATGGIKPCVSSFAADQVI